MATKTPKLGLTKPAPDDFADIAVLNENMDVLDAAVASKAERADNPVYYGLCDTAAGTASKVVVCAGFALSAGKRISVKFTYANTTSAPTLNVNNTGAIAVKSFGATADTLTNRWRPLGIVDFVYDGTNWVMQESSVASGDYYGLVKATNLNGTKTAAPSFYAPTSAGSSGQVLSSNGNGAPTWKTPTTVNLNGSTTTAPAFYAPTAAGSGGQILTSNGSGAPVWKTPGSVVVNKPAITITGVTGQTTTVKVTRIGTGAITAASDNTAVATVSVSGTTLTITAKGSGNATITVNVAATSTHTSASCGIGIACDVVDTVLNNNTWAKIREYSDAGLASSVWPVGATKSVTVNGMVGTLSINQPLWVFIIGFNHNSDYEGKNKIHFQGFKTAQSGGADVGLVDNDYENYYTNSTKYFNMEHWSYANYGGWAASDTRYDVLGSTNKAPSNYGSAKASGAVGYDATATCALNPVNGTLMAALPSDLRAVMKPITKYSDNKAGGTNVAENISATVDYLPLLAEFEVHGARNFANSAEQNYQAQYAYYKNGNSKIKYKYNATATAVVWWLRSAYYNNTNFFCAVSSSGSPSYNYSNYSRALAPAFAV